jgi:magnesium chelatase subunit D
MAASPCALSLWAAQLLAVDAAALGGLRLRGAAGPLRDAWLDALRSFWPRERPWQRLPCSTSDERLFGGLDLVATLAQGHVVLQRGLLAQCDGGLVSISMAERLPLRVAMPLAGVLDRGEIVIEREGFAARHAARLGVLALDESLPEDGTIFPAALAERLALDVWLEHPAPAAPAAESLAPPGAVPEGECWPALPDERALARARSGWRDVRVPEGLLRALCEAAWALGVASLRRAWLAQCVLRMAAALAGRAEAAAPDLQLALALAVVPHATRWPEQAEAAGEGAPALAEDERAACAAPPNPAPEPSPEQPNAGSAHDPSREPGGAPDGGADAAQPGAQTLVAATLARLPPGLLATLAGTAAARGKTAHEGRAGAVATSQLRGRPLGSRRADPRGGGRLSLIDTLRAAAPWQRLRRADLRPETAARPRLLLRRDDLRVTLRAQRRGSTTIFVIDASGSSAAHRLAEAKGAVELLLAESYVRRDEVAVIAFRGTEAPVILPPTRSLVRAKRALAGLPGGGGTPLAAALQAAADLAEQVARRGSTPCIVLLTDGRANVARSRSTVQAAAGAARGSPGRGAAREAAGGAPGGARDAAQADAVAAARHLALAAARRLVIDTSPIAGAAAQRIAHHMGAAYLPLPHARADAVTAAARALRG